MSDQEKRDFLLALWNADHPEDEAYSAHAVATRGEFQRLELQMISGELLCVPVWIGPTDQERVLDHMYGAFKRAVESRQRMGYEGPIFG